MIYNLIYENQNIIINNAFDVDILIIFNISNLSNLINYINVYF